METTRLRQLTARASLAMRTSEFRQAIETYRELEAGQPDNPAWSQRRADAHHALGQRDEELAARIRAADLFVDQGRVIEAITACKLILTLDPKHSAIEERLHRLYSEAGNQLEADEPALETPTLFDDEFGEDEEAPAETPEYIELDLSEEDDDEHDDDIDVDVDVDVDEEIEREAQDLTPFEELMLIEVVPGAHSAGIGEACDEDISEIPLGDDPNERSTIGLDLDLEAIELSGDAIVELSERPEPAPASSPLEQLAPTPLFGSLDARTMKKLMGLVELVELRAGEVLFRQGDRSGALYVIAEGAMVPIVEGNTPQRLGVLEQGEFFGEIGLITRQPRNATMQALVDTRLLALDGKVMWKLMKARPAVFQVMLRFLRERLIDRFSRTSPFFAAISRAERGAVAQQFDFLEAADASVLVQQDTPAESLFILLAGEMQAVDIGFEGDKVLGTIHPGDLFGELSMLAGEPARAAVVANGKCWLLALPRRRFERILAGNPKLEKVITLMARERARRSGEGTGAVDPV